MVKKKKRMSEQERIMSRTVGLTAGVIGLGVLQGVSNPLTGTAGTIVQQGVLPVAGLGLLGFAGQPLTNKKRKRRK